MTDLGRDTRDAAPAAIRRAREPLFTGFDFAAFVVSLVMVCMPLALGAISNH